METIETSLPTIGQLRNSEMVRSTFEYWFADHMQVRSPFPFYVQQDVREKAVPVFHDWMHKLNPQAIKEIDEGIAHEKFEEILFEVAMPLVKTDDEVLTLRFPFLPRCGDPIDGGDIAGRQGENIVRSRSLVKDGKHEFMAVEAENRATGTRWETRFELP